MKENKENSNKTCSTGACGCSANYIWGGIAIICFVIAIAFIFGN